MEILKILIGGLVLIMGYFIGGILAKTTKEELKTGQKYFKIIIWSSLLGGFFGAIISDDVLMFSFFFIAIITSRSLIRN